MAEYVSFRALYDYTPQQAGEISLVVGDECLVKKPLPHGGVNGWLDGVNLRSKAAGQFPGTYCEVMSMNARPPIPRAVKPELSKNHQPILCNGHKLEQIIAIKPVWCTFCQDYIWGGGNISIICKVCRLCAHTGCHQVFQDHACGAKTPQGQKPIEEILKAVHEWSCEDVLEWMIAARLHPYIKIFREQQITGHDLPNIYEEDLKQYGIEFNLHAKIIRMCIEELLTEHPQNIMPLSGTFNKNLAIETHEKLYEHSFTSLQHCDLCRKVMFGLFSQGFMCAVCGLQCHRPCAFASIQECMGFYQRGRRPSDSEEPSFCCTYDTVNIPIVMKNCINVVERRGLREPNIYSTNASYEQSQSLRSALNQDPKHVNMDDDYWQDPRCAAYVLRTFLLELPIPLISSNCYELFLDLAICDNPTSNKIVEAMNTLPDHCYSHLNFVLRHLIKVSTYSEENCMTIPELARIFSILLVRPLEYESSKFVANLDLHEKIVHILLLQTKEQVQSMEYASTENADSLNEEIWFWAAATRKDVERRLQGTPDGSFIVRPSELRRGEWTLTVRKEGKERMIKIMQRNGRYGFREGLLNYSSLKELVSYFTMHSLVSYNETLDVFLTYPCGPRTNNQQGIENKALLTERYNRIDSQLKEIKLLEYEAEDKQKLLEECKILSESQTDVINFIHEQIELANDQLKEVPNSDKSDIQNSLANLYDLMRKEEATWSQLDENLVLLKHECDIVNARLTELSTELPNLQEEYERIYQKMRDANPDVLKVKENEDLKEIYDYLPNVRETLPRDRQERNSTFSDEILDEKYWLFPHKLAKTGIANMLENKPDGTFLVRMSDNYPFVISLVHDNSIKHVPIHRGPNGYGFAEPHNTYQTLTDLVNHYHNQSLRMHNKKLDTTLQTPYRFLEHTNDGPIYE